MGPLRQNRCKIIFGHKQAQIEGGLKGDWGYKSKCNDTFFVAEGHSTDF